MKKTELEELSRKILQCKHVIGLSFEAGVSMDSMRVIEIEIDIDKYIDEDDLIDLLNNIKLFNLKQNNIKINHCIR